MMRVVAQSAVAAALVLLIGCSTTVQAPQVAALGEPAPSFTLSDTEGRQYSLEALTDEGPVVLFFFCDT